MNHDAQTSRDSPVFSIVLTTHDRPGLLEEAVASVVAQTVTGWELIIVDDASTPPVDKARWPDLPGELTVIRNASIRGGAAGKAIGAAAARGHYVAFLDDDDLFAPSLLERAAAAFESHPAIEVLFIGVQWFGSQAGPELHDQEESMRRVVRIAPPKETGDGLRFFDDRLFEGLLAAVPMAFQRVVVRRSALERIGPHRAGCLMWDCDWALRAVLVARCALLDEALYRQRADGQAYYSRPGREQAQLESALEITLRLHQDPPPGAAKGVRALLRAAAGRHASSLAYFHAMHGPLSSSLAAWWRSQRLHPGITSASVPLSALARAARRRFRTGA
jgi:glycosyltransferase involved in cell wall biosynthesis